MIIIITIIMIKDITITIVLHMFIGKYYIIFTSFYYIINL
jgi:hypothetical protein